MEMSHGEVQEDRTKELMEEMTEENFLKDLYLFMKKRDTVIERIPHLGFKQIDLFLMFNTVKELGGYQQVTSQQLWKQVYNKLGGNPRSTSAATCTRRHYEKLLLPYECHIKGELMNTLIHQPKQFHYIDFSKDDDGQRPAKRKILAMPLHQNSHNLLSDPHASDTPLPFHFPHYYHPVLPPYIPVSPSVLTSHSPPDPQPQFSYNPPPLSSTNRIKQPLEHLRYLAKQYKSSSGLAEPLNLSIKASSQETNSQPASSFAPPSSSKNPKFLNKPSPLYPSNRVMRNEGCETQDSEEDQGRSSPVAPRSHSLKASEGYITNLKSTAASSSPTYDSPFTLRTDAVGPTTLLKSSEGTSTMAHIPSSLKTDFTHQPTEEREGSPEAGQRGLSLSQILQSAHRENGGKMEIEIPLSLLHSWMRLWRPLASKQLSTQEEHAGTGTQKNYRSSDTFPTDPAFHSRDQEWSSAADNPNPRPRRVPSPTPTIQTQSDHHTTSHYQFTSCKPLPSADILKNAASQDVYPTHQQDISMLYSSKPKNVWHAYVRDSQAAPIQLQKTDSSAFAVPQDFSASKLSEYKEVMPQRARQKPEMRDSSVLMPSSNPASVLHLTTEELLKLKKIISTSS
ncbi:hypothetical protein LDENG_00208710 [Lucifuga dentata]|nr:hypothetical protein LDENG_00208710 [Lucifuga dentata]